MLLKNNASRKFFLMDFHKFCKFICVYPTRIHELSNTHGNYKYGK